MILTILGIAAAIATPVGAVAAALAAVFAAHHSCQTNQTVQGMRATMVRASVIMATLLTAWMAACVLQPSHGDAIAAIDSNDTP